MAEARISTSGFSGVVDGRERVGVRGGRAVARTAICLPTGGKRVVTGLLGRTLCSGTRPLMTADTTGTGREGCWTATLASTTSSGSVVLFTR